MLSERNRTILAEWRDHWANQARLVDEIIKRCDTDPDYGRYVQIRIQSGPVAVADGNYISCGIIPPQEWDSAIYDLADAAVRYNSVLLRGSISEKLESLGFQRTDEAIAYVQRRKDQNPGGTP